MATIYICFSPDDASFVSLLRRLLLFHRLETDFSDVEAGRHIIDDSWLDPAILKADVFLLVLTRSLMQSDWARHELNTFLACGSGKMVCLALDEIDPAQFSASLKRRVLVNFHSNLESGFEALFAELGTAFLAAPDLRLVSGRRKTGERRLSSTAVRLREGCLKAYREEQPGGEYLRIARSTESRFLVHSALMKEARRYNFFDRASGLPRAPEQVLDEALSFVWGGGDTSGGDIAVDLVEDIASVVNRNSRVEPLERRRI